MVMVKRLLPSYLMYVIIQELRLYFVSTSLTCKAMALLVLSIVSKKLIITWQYSHLELKKCTIITKVSTPTLDIHKSENQVRFRLAGHVELRSSSHPVSLATQNPSSGSGWILGYGSVLVKWNQNWVQLPG
jgi:hypothetical protein